MVRGPDRKSQRSIESQKLCRAGRSNARYEPLSLPIDEHASPSLVVKAVSAQQTLLFTNFVLSSFPCYFKCTETRVSVNWVEYVDRRRGSSNTCFDWAIRCLTTLYTGHLYNDKRFVDAGRIFYMRALRSLAGLLGNVATAKSDEALATAIVLAVFEKHVCTTPESWMQHAAGIKVLMQLRGPEAHLHGFARAMYIVYRQFLVTAAFISGEACFLEEPEWLSLSEQIAADNARQPDSSVFTDIVERAFREIVKTPGYVKRVREMLALSPKKQAALRPKLLQRILATRAALRGMHTEFGVVGSALQAGRDRKDEFIGPIPHLLFDGFSKLSIRGIRSGIILLNHLVWLLDPKQRSAIEVENRTLLSDHSITESKKPLHKTANELVPSSPLTPPKSPGEPKLVIESLINSKTKEPPTTDWMDRIVITMGMDGVRVSLSHGR